MVNAAPLSSQTMHFFREVEDVESNGKTPTAFNLFIPKHKNQQLFFVLLHLTITTISNERRTNYCDWNSW